MKISYNWLKEYVNINFPAEEAGRVLTETGLEVESIERVGVGTEALSGVVVGEVLQCEKHPDADRLKLTQVDLGGEVVQIVCGASNVAVGQKVLVATVGSTILPHQGEPIKIKAAKIRGVESFGMICAEDELGLGSSHDGIMVLDSSAKPGIPASDYLKLEEDFVLEIGLTPNRSDAMGHIGVARDLKAALNTHYSEGLKLNWPDIKHSETANKFPLELVVEDHEKCPRYLGIVINNIQVGTSPEWLQKRLRSIGITPINNVVDVTNFVLFELGTPLHAFDLKSFNRTVFVRPARPGEKLKTLDGIERELATDDLVIANENQALCLAGILGGLDSGVQNSTTDIFLESAVFNSVSIRKSAKKYAISTDASFRFERGVDPALTEYALLRTAQLIKEVAGGELTQVEQAVGNLVIDPRELIFNLQHFYRLVGNLISVDKIKHILCELDIQILQEEGDNWTLLVSPYRTDVTREVDVIEEVLRIYGYNLIQEPEKLKMSIPYFPKPDKEKIQMKIAEFLVAKGFYELLNNSLTKSSYVRQFGGEALKESFQVKLLNPLSQDLDVMRQSLLFNTLEVVAYNQNRQHPDLRLFEFGSIYQKFSSGYHENKRLLIALSGRKSPEIWNASTDSFNFFSLKGIVESLLERLGLRGLLEEKALKKSLFDDGLQLMINGSKIGEIGWISKEMRQHFGIKNDVFIADIDWEMLLQEYSKDHIRFEELPKTFQVRRDFSLLLDQACRFDSIVELAKKNEKTLLKDVQLFDVYEGKNLDAGKKSYAVAFYFQDPNQTLKDQQVDAAMERIRSSLEKELGATLR